MNVIVEKNGKEERLVHDWNAKSSIVVSCETPEHAIDLIFRFCLNAPFFITEIVGGMSMVTASTLKHCETNVLLLSINKS